MREVFFKQELDQESFYEVVRNWKTQNALMCISLVNIPIDDIDWDDVTSLGKNVQDR